MLIEADLTGKNIRYILVILSAEQNTFLSESGLG